MRKRKNSKNEEVKQKIQSLFQKEMLSGLRSVYISTDPEGNLQVFKKYTIRKNEHGHYVVTHGRWEEERTFLNARNAVSYCVLHNVHNHSQARRLYDLDCKLSAVNVDIAIHSKTCKNPKQKYDIREIAMVKLEGDLQKKKQIVGEMQNHINNSMQEQRKIFDSLRKKNFSETKKLTEEDKYIYSHRDY